MCMIWKRVSHVEKPSHLAVSIIFPKKSSNQQYAVNLFEKKNCYVILIMIELIYIVNFGFISNDNVVLLIILIKIKLILFH